LEKPEWADAIWTVPVLHAAQNFSLQDRDKGEHGEKNSEQCTDVKENRREGRYPIGHSGKQRQDPLLRANENLVDRLAQAR